MSIIRFSDEEVFDCDSSEYEILHRGVLACKGTDGAIVEIGTRKGGSAKIIIDSLVINGDTDRSMFCIDPYGNIEYACTNLQISVHGLTANISTDEDPLSKDSSKSLKLDYYPNEMRNRIIPSLYYYAYSKGLNFSFFCMEDTEFFKRFQDGVPVYQEYKKIEDKYAFVFFDGPHVNEAVKSELDYFIPRAPIGAVFVADDIWMYNHDLFESIVFGAGFETLEKGSIKASYIRTK